MKQHTITTYSFNELSDDAKTLALSNAAQDEFLGERVLQESLESLKGFADFYNLNLDYSFGIFPDRGEFIRATIDNDELSELSGVRLYKYLENNYSTYYKTVKDSSELINNPQKPKKTLAGECPFTGVCYDENLLDEMRNFMKKPDERTFQDLINDCTDSFMTDIHKEGEYLSSDEALIENIEANEVEFYESGQTY